MKTETDYQHRADEALAMMEHGRPTPRARRRELIDGLYEDWTETFSCFGTPAPAHGIPLPRTKEE